MTRRIAGWLALAVGLLALTACSGLDVSSVLPGRNGQTTEAEPPLTASGFLEAEEVSVVSEVSGRVAEVRADEADEVGAGDVVIVLDDSLLRADRAQAVAAVNTAEANLRELRAGPNEEDVAAADAAVQQAQTAVQGARRSSGQAWTTASNPLEVNAEIAQVALEMAQLQQQIDEAEAALREVDYEIQLVEQGEDEDRTRLEFLNFTRDQIIAQIASLQARYDGAVQRQALLETRRANPVELVAQARTTSSQIGVAEARLSLAEAQRAAVLAGARDEEIAITNAQIALAEAQVALIDAQIAQRTLVAPIGGVVTTRSIAVGETASPGVPLLNIADLRTLTLTVYIPETRIGLVRLGAPVEIEVAAYPRRTFEGEVVSIGREAEFTPRNVQTDEERVNLVFAVEIAIDNADGRLKPGMPADAMIDPADELSDSADASEEATPPSATAQPEATAVPATTTPSATEMPEPTVEPTPTPGGPITVGGAALVYVPGGTIALGRAGQATDVTLSPFYIDRTEVTVADWEACVADGACEEPSSTVNYSGEPYYEEDAFARYPVTSVTWFDADQYCSWRGARLPTSAEWEMAARWDPASGTTTVYPWGDEWDASRLNACDTSCPLSDGSATGDDGYPETAPVGSFPGGASPVGALDMAGNAAEWVADWYGDAPAPDGATDPTGPETGSGRVVRGGAWGVSRADLFSMDRRIAFAPDEYGPGVGFRCAISADAAGEAAP